MADAFSDDPQGWGEVAGAPIPRLRIVELPITTTMTGPRGGYLIIMDRCTETPKGWGEVEKPANCAGILVFPDEVDLPQLDEITSLREELNSMETSQPAIEAESNPAVWEAIDQALIASREALGSVTAGPVWECLAQHHNALSMLYAALRPPSERERTKADPQVRALFPEKDE